MARKKYQGANRHQKAAHRRGEERVGREMIEELLDLSHGFDPADRELAGSSAKLHGRSFVLFNVDLRNVPKGF